MTLAGSVLMILTGFAVMSFGLLLFYAWLPLLYALVGFDIGILLGQMIFGDLGTWSIVLGLAGAVLLGVASYLLEPYRRILIGVATGFLLGLALAAALDLETVLGGVFGRMLAFIFAIIGGVVVSRYFDLFLIGASAAGGAALVMTGAHNLLPGIGLFDRASGHLAPALLTLVLAVLGIAWQYRNMTTWVTSFPSGKN